MVVVLNSTKRKLTRRPNASTVLDGARPNCSARSADVHGVGYVYARRCSNSEALGPDAARGSSWGESVDNEAIDG
jgi:hypothetical protein